MKELQAKVFSEEKYRLGESPFYDPRFDRLSWVDILAGRLYTLAQGKPACADLQEPIGAAVPMAADEGFLAAGQTGLWRWRNGTRELLLDLTKEYKPWQRSNDAKADPRGRLFFGSSALDGSGETGGNLYRYDAAGLTCVQPDTRISNGMAWRSDSRKFYFSDSLYHGVFSYDYDPETGEIRNRQLLFPVSDGVPDGMCIDSEDHLWLAVWGGRRVECRDSRDGSLKAVVHVTAEHVTSCCFGGPEMRRLWITTSGEGLSGEHDGKIFFCDLAVSGKAPDYAF